MWLWMRLLMRVAAIRTHERFSCGISTPAAELIPCPAGTLQAFTMVSPMGLGLIFLPHDICYID
jgi:hypothetical protein